MAVTSSRVIVVAGVLALGGCRTASTPAPSPPPAVPAAKGAAPQVATNDGSKIWLAENAVPRFFPNYVKDCTDHGQLVTVMKKGLNPALNRVTEALFHDDGEEEERLATVADAAAELLGCAPVVGRYRMEEPEKDWPTFDMLLYDLVVHTHALQNAALEDDLEVTRHWYYHVKQSCAACHARFWDRGGHADAGGAAAQVE